MNIELLKDVVRSIIGEKANGIVDLLSVKKNVNEFIIAKKLSLSINQTRNLLYKLIDEGLVSVMRKKNKKKGGWYDHFWTLNMEKSLFKLKETITKKIDALKQQIQIKKNARCYYCETCSSEFNEEQALLQEYTCLECGQLLVAKDNSKDIIVWEKEIIKLEKDLQEVISELEILIKHGAKLRDRRMHAEEVKKTKERKAKRKTAKDLKNKSAKVRKKGKVKKTNKTSKTSKK